MEIQEALQWTDRLLLTTTGKHLDTLQRAILEGAWQGTGYRCFISNSPSPVLGEGEPGNEGNPRRNVPRTVLG